MNLAATLFRMTVEECLIGRDARRGAGARAVRTAGTLEAGKRCDLAIWNIERPGGAGLSHGIQSAARARVEGRMNTPAPSRLAVGASRRCAADRELSAHRHRDSRRRSKRSLVSPWLARKDTDFWVDVLYDFAHELGATTIRTALSRTVIDVNRDPSGASLYPGQTTTGLCPLETFDGEPLYKSGSEPGPAEFLRRRAEYFDPYHAALAPSWNANARDSAAWCSTMRTRSARACRGCSTASCRSSTSAPTTA